MLVAIQITKNINHGYISLATRILESTGKVFPSLSRCTVTNPTVSNDSSALTQIAINTDSLGRWKYCGMNKFHDMLNDKPVFNALINVNATNFNNPRITKSLLVLVFIIYLLEKVLG